MNIVSEILCALWFILPAYAANAFPPLMKGKIPIDRGKKLGKYRILGDGKTVEGTLGGIAFGIFIGLTQIFFQSKIPRSMGLVEMTLPLILALSIGALTGDIIGSFIKRRLGIERGRPAPLLDQLDFLALAILFSSLLTRIKILHIFLLIILTPIIHYSANILGYLLRIKRVPY
ncbi:MAG: CDP-2,3-bis-(O-geranylgeranyl)-sn-glycerol synthase [Candidatus Aenigmatarchaeota archaeon]